MDVVEVEFLHLTAGCANDETLAGGFGQWHSRMRTGSCDARLLQIDRLGTGVIGNLRSIMGVLLCSDARNTSSARNHPEVKVVPVENQILGRRARYLRY